MLFFFFSRHDVALAANVLTARGRALHAPAAPAHVTSMLRLPSTILVTRAASVYRTQTSTRQAGGEI